MIHHGDLFDVLPTLAAESVDACVTDPPYGIGFMGREWDTFKPEIAEKKQGLRQINKSESYTRKQKRLINPNLKGRTVEGQISSSQIEYDYSAKGLREFQAWTERWSREVFRVLKPGAYIVVCGAPRAHHRMMCGLEDAGFEIRDCFAWLFGSGFPKSRNLGNGKGTALKPANEPIALAWKPFKGSITACHERHGTAALNVDACRIGDDDTRRVKEGGANQFPHEDDSWTPKTVTVGSEFGRWPANVILDAEAASVLDEQAGDRVSGHWPTDRGEGGYEGGFTGQSGLDGRNGSVGGASRFYYVAKPSREERDMGCYDLQSQNADAYAEHRGRRMETPTRFDGKPLSQGRNIHPTVKPVELMRWLVKLVTPINGTVLDPFLGSGTTGMACVYEQREFIGIEREAEYVTIAQRRIAAVAPLFTEIGA